MTLSTWELETIKNEVAEVREFYRQRMDADLPPLREEMERLSRAVGELTEKQRVGEKQAMLARFTGGGRGGERGGDRPRVPFGKYQGMDALDLACVRSVLAAQQREPGDVNPRALEDWQANLKAAMDSTTAGAGDELVATGRWTGWKTGDWVGYPLNAAPMDPGGRPYTRIVATAGGRRFPLSRGGVIINGAWGYGDVREDAGLQVSGAAAAGDTEVTVAASGDVSASLSAGHTVRIGEEQMYVTAASDDGLGTITLAVQRGMNGTTAATHAVGSGVFVYRYPAAVTEACLLQAAVWWRERLSAPFRPDAAFDRSTGDGRGDVAGISPEVRALLKPYRRRVAVLGV